MIFFFLSPQGAGVYHFRGTKGAFFSVADTQDSKILSTKASLNDTLF